MTFKPNDPYELERVQRRVKLGTTLLDEHYDRWHEAIDLAKLNMELTDRCVIGQISGHPDFGRPGRDYNDLLPFLFSDWTGDEAESAAAHGFDIAGGEYWTEEYAALGHEWSGIIKERQDK